jgi:hypothetical protein
LVWWPRALLLSLCLGCSSETDPAPNPCEGAPAREFERCPDPADPGGPRIDSITGPSCVRVYESANYELSFREALSPNRIVGLRVSGELVRPTNPSESRWPPEKPPRDRFTYVFAPNRAGETTLQMQFVDEKNIYGPALCGDVSVR